MKDIMKEHFEKVLIFGGTTEGRKTAEHLLAQGVPCTVSVATPYGRDVLAPHPLLTVRVGRMDRDAMAQMMQDGKFCCVVDATHPHAQIVSAEIAAACGQAGLPCIRQQREGTGTEAPEAEKIGGTQESGEASESRCANAGACYYVDNAEEAGRFLSAVPGHILVTTGSKELGRFVNALGDPARITARVLPSEESLRACGEAGLSGRQIIALQGPFDTEMNCAMIRHTGAQWLLTKDSGAAGGYPEKLEAAGKCGIGTVVIRMPHTGHAGGAAGSDVTGGTRDAGERTLFLVGIGMGAQDAVTAQAQKAIAGAEVLFGAESVLANAEKLRGPGKEQRIVPVYEGGAVLAYLQTHPQVRRAAVLYSGDSGFYSGAASMLEKIKQEKVRSGQPDPAQRSGLQVRVICGVSCVSWFAARAGIPWQDWKILSSHGRFCNIVGQVRRNRKCFLLLSGAADLRLTGQLLADAAGRGVLGELKLICGYALSRPEEEIRAYTAQELTGITKEGLYVLYIEHEAAGRTPVLPGLPDGAFVRGKAPMTSSEIRALSLSRLGLTAQAVVWDIGAGTGSVSVEAALTCPEGKVYSVEFRREALELLEQNCAGFCLQNMEIVEGRAPDILADLPAPSHVFVGGSGGEIGSILEAVFAKNASARVVVNCITSETLAALQCALKKLPVRDIQCAQISVNREEKLGNYHYLRAGNPVFMISFSGDAANAESREREDR